MRTSLALHVLLELHEKATLLRPRPVMRTLVRRRSRMEVGCRVLHRPVRRHPCGELPDMTVSRLSGFLNWYSPTGTADFMYFSKRAT